MTFGTPVSFPDTATQAAFIYHDRIDGSNPAKMLFGNILAVKMSPVRYIALRLTPVSSSIWPHE